MYVDSRVRYSLKDRGPPNFRREKKENSLPRPWAPLHDKYLEKLAADGRKQRNSGAILESGLRVMAA
jgi:hypothetical protein